MTNFLGRYQAGEHEAVWDELTALGVAVADEPARSEAWAVACETMRRAKHNIEILVPRLEQLGYQFGSLPDDANYWQDVPVVVPPPAETGDFIEEIERLIGPIPLSLRAWFEIVGHVNLVGFHPSLPAIELLDPMWVGHSFAHYGEEWRPTLRLEFEEWQENQEEEEEEKVGPFLLELAPDCFHKANISGGPPYGVAVSLAAADGEWANYWKPTTFVGYLRDCFRWGGFPGLKLHGDTTESSGGTEDNSQFASRAVQMPAGKLEFLTRDLLPL